MLFTYQQVQKQVGIGSVTWSGTQALSVPPPCRPPHMSLSLLDLPPSDYRMAAVAPIPRQDAQGRRATRELFALTQGYFASSKISFPETLSRLSVTSLARLGLLVKLQKRQRRQQAYVSRCKERVWNVWQTAFRSSVLLTSIP